MKNTNINLELISDIEQHLFIEKGWRGSISIKTLKKGVANNCFFNGYLLENVENYSYLGNILEVGTEYSKELHDLHNDYLFCTEHKIITSDMLSEHKMTCYSEHKIITSDMLSDCSKEIAAKHFKNTHTKINKLVPNLCSKEQYTKEKNNTRKKS